MANISAIKKVSHVITVDEITAQGGTIPVLWDSPFYDTNYVVNYTIEFAQGAGTYIFPDGVTELKPNGFTAGWTIGDQVAGDIITVHAMASHK